MRATVQITKITLVEVRAHNKALTINVILNNQLEESMDTELPAPQVLINQEEEPAGSVMDTMLTMENPAPVSPGSVTGRVDLHMVASVAAELAIMAEAVVGTAEEPEVRLVVALVEAEAEEAIAKHKLVARK